jgi:hypothetical protein
MTRPALEREDGWVLVSAIVLMAIMLSVGLASFAFVDTNQDRARESRERESTLSLAEGALYAQGFALARAWPNATQPPLAADCSSALVTTRFCPDRDTLAAASSGNTAVAQFSSTDFQANATWTTSVRDNTGVLAAAYDPTLADNTLIDPVYGACPSTPCRMDWNRDRQLWVQSSAVVRGRPRNIVARMKLEELRESAPSAGVVAGGINVSNSGNNQMVDGTGTSVQLRCSVSSPQCANYKSGQVSPAPVGSTGVIPPLLTPSQLIRFRDRAITDGRYYAGCPTVDPATGMYNVTGTVVWVEHCDNPPNFANNVQTVPCTGLPAGMKPNCVNAPDKPGMLIWHCGRIDFQGNFTFVGILYNANNSDGTCDPPVTKSGNCFAGNQLVGPADAIITNGGFGVWGAVAIDGGGCLHVGSNGMQIKFNGNAWDALKSYGTVGLVQNTWRELKAG